MCNVCGRIGVCSCATFKPNYPDVINTENAKLRKEINVLYEKYDRDSNIAVEVIVKVKQENEALKNALAEARVECSKRYNKIAGLEHTNTVLREMVDDLQKTEKDLIETVARERQMRVTAEDFAVQLSRRVP